MSAFGPVNFQRLEEFPSFISCIKVFGRPIIPPLLTPSYRHELKQLRTVATIKEAEISRRKNELLKKRQQNPSSMSLKNDYVSGFQSCMQESCALWYPSSKDNQDGISVAISKFPTSAIYSSVHTGAIVCSNVIENSDAYIARTAKDTLYGSEASVIGCIQCSHNNFNPECSLCVAEYSQSFQNRSFATDLSPEVPCRTFSLLQRNVDAMNEDLNSNLDETECESLPTIICNQKYIPPDTDSESIVTCMTQSTDLGKYMEFSNEYSSSDNSTIMSDSKSISQQFTFSRSDDASSETIVNTENELTPCASTMAELTDNIEDELSNADEIAGVSDNKEFTTGTMKRAHSVDSYMKILQTCARNMNVKKSMSEPFNTNQETDSCDIGTNKSPASSKTGLLIKEDSKESEESKEIPEKDVPLQENNEISVRNDNKANLQADISDSFQKKHVRQNSYTLDHPSSALILAHADCTCNFDAKCLSPHCSALKNEDEVMPNFAFTKEKVDISECHHHMLKLPILSSEDSPDTHPHITFIKDDMTSTVIDVFPVVKEDSCEKYNSGNLKESDSAIVSETATSENDSKVNEEEAISGILLENLKISSDVEQQEFINHICELQAFYEKRVKELRQEQNRQWLKLDEEFKQKEKLLYDQLHLAYISSTGSVSKAGDGEKDEMKNNFNSSIDGKIPGDKLASEKEDLSASNTSSLSDHIPSSDSSLTHVSILTVPSGNPQSSCSYSKTPNPSQKFRASVSPARESKSSHDTPFVPVENIKNGQVFNDSSVSPHSLERDEQHVCSISESVPSVNGFFSTSSSHMSHTNSLPKYPIAIAVPIDKKCDNIPTCSCDNSQQQCRYCASFSGYCEYERNSSDSGFVSFPLEQNSVLIAENVNSHRNFPDKNMSTVTIQSKSLDSDDVNCSNCKCSRKSMSLSSKKSSDFTSVVHNSLEETWHILSLDNGKKYNGVIEKEIKSMSQAPKEKSQLPVNSMISLCAKTLKNGSFDVEDAILSKKAVDDPGLMKKFEKLPAFVKGYLTRRLFQTERVQSLIKTLQDTALLIGKLSEDLPTKGDPVSQRDVDFHRQLIVQLMTTFHNVYDIFCTISTKERMNIITESRNFRMRKENVDQNGETSPPVATKTPALASTIKHKLSSATLKALERKKRPVIDSRTYTVEDFRKSRSRSVIDMRTYTIDDLPSFRGRTCSSMSSKSLSVSPSSVYKSSVGSSLKRKTASAKSSVPRRCPYKWVP